MKVLIIGGYISKEKRGGAGIAVWEICNALSKTNDVYWLPLTSISDLHASFNKNNNLNGVKIIYKKLPLKVFINTVESFFNEGFKSISRYVDILIKRLYYALLFAYVDIQQIYYIRYRTRYCTYPWFQYGVLSFLFSQ